MADEQLPQAIAMAPDLVSLAAGGNDLLRAGGDPDTLADIYDETIRTLLAAGCPVLMFTGFDPRFPVLRLIRGKVAAFNMHLRAIADQHQCYLVDLWSMQVLADPRAWSADRLHLTPDGHRRVALRACEVLGVPVTADWREPWLPPSGHVSAGPGLAGGPPDGPAVGAGARGAVGGAAAARRLIGRWDSPEAPRIAAAVAGCARCRDQLRAIRLASPGARGVRCMPASPAGGERVAAGTGRGMLRRRARSGSSCSGGRPGPGQARHRGR